MELCAKKGSEAGSWLGAGGGGNAVCAAGLGGKG